MNARLTLTLLAASALAGCASTNAPATAVYDPNVNAAVCLLKPFARGANGAVVKADMENGIKAGFDTADSDRNGRLNFEEVNALNAAHASDCDQTNWINYDSAGMAIDQYGARYRTAFEQADVNADGIATAEEIVTSKRQLPTARRKPSEAPDPGPTRNPTGSPTGTGSPY